jgi:hypothetical protein
MSCVRSQRLPFDAEGLLFDAKGLVFDAKGLVFDAKGLVFDTEGLVFDAEALFLTRKALFSTRRALFRGERLSTADAENRSARIHALEPSGREPGKKRTHEDDRDENERARPGLTMLVLIRGTCVGVHLHGER